MIDFAKESIIPELIDLAERGACIQTLIVRIEAQATLQSIDLTAAPYFAGVTEGDHEYRAYTNWTQALYAGLLHHAALMKTQNLANVPFIEYASRPSTKFGVSAFLLDFDTENAGIDMGAVGELEDLGNIEAYDLTTDNDNRQTDWVDWIRGPEQIVCGVNTWLEVCGGFDLEVF